MVLNTHPPKVRIRRWRYVGHDNLKVELRVFLNIKSHPHCIFMKTIKRTLLEKSGNMSYASVLQYS